MLLDGTIESRARAIGMLGTRPDARELTSTVVGQF